ncbi:MAG TPA: gliding motility-associated C-terminal domain-containing protein [Flavilitoribacter sp.]|nr:gliding motility-associated C-terminal domain-containing protein [Flavilitoribacter sp.]
MKSLNLRYIGLQVVVVILFTSASSAQNTFCYPLNENLASGFPGAPSLVVLPNGNGQGGGFQSTSAPQSFCNEPGEIQAFHFEENAGLAFYNPADFINCDYTVEFLVRFEQLPANTLFDAPWVWLFGAYSEDDGIFIFRDILFNRIYLEFWDGNNRLQTVLFNEFNTNDWFHFTITRDCSGQVKVYINCLLFTTFDDSVHQILKISPATGNQFIFFQDDPQILTAEAAPGFVRNISISNAVLPESQILGACNCVCESLQDNCTVEVTVENFTCLESEVGTVVDTVSAQNVCGCACDSIITTITSLLPPGECLMCSDTLYIDTVFCAGQLFNGVGYNADTTFCISQLAVSGCDSFTCYSISVLPSFSTLIDTVLCPGETVTSGNSVYSVSGTFLQNLSAANGCDSLVTLHLQVLETESVSLDTAVCQGHLFKGINILRDTVVCDTLIGSQGCQTSFCYHIEAVPADTVYLAVEICQGNAYSFGNTNISTAGRYYQAFVSGSSGCDSIVALDLSVLPRPTVTVDSVVCFSTLFENTLLVRDTLICVIRTNPDGCETEWCYQFDVIEIKVTEINDVLCKGGAYAFADTLLTEPGGYIGYFVSADGCDSLVALTLSEALPPNVQIYGKDVTCPGAVSTLYAANGFAGYQWNTSPADTSYLIKIDQPGAYGLTVTDENGCAGSDSITVTNFPAYVLSVVQSDPESCLGASDGALGVQPVGGQPPFVFQWSTGESSSVISGLSSGEYDLNVRDGNGCLQKDTFFLPVKELPGLDLEIRSPACGGGKDGTIIVHGFGGTAPYLYAMGNTPFQTDSVFTDLEPGQYALSLQDAKGCEGTTTGEVTAAGGFEIALIPSATVITQGDTVVISASGPSLDKLEWAPAFSLDCPTCLSVKAYPETTTMYTVTGSNNAGCMDSSSVIITVLRREEEVRRKLYVPDAFSPDGNGINDRFEVFLGDPSAVIQSFRIFNRWGDLVFEGGSHSASNNDIFWDGKILGKYAGTSVYVWKIDVKYADGVIAHFKGGVTLIR